MCDTGYSPAAYSPLDVSYISQLAQTQASNNIANSLALERQYAPAMGDARNAYQGQILSNISQIQPLQNLVNQGAGTIAQGLNYTPQTLGVPQLGAMPITSQYNNLVSQGLQNPGLLPQSVQNQVLGQAAAGGQSMQRPVSAADLGLNSNQLQSQNLSQGANAGAQQQQLNLAQQAIQNQMNQVNQALTQQNLQRQAQATGQLSSLTAPLYSSLEQVGNTPLPQSGLSPSAVSDLAVSQNNALNQYYQQAAAAQNQQSQANNQFYAGLLSSVAGAAGGLMGGGGGGGSGVQTSGSGMTVGYNFSGNPSSAGYGLNQNIGLHF